jgi:hypothetical protein
VVYAVVLDWDTLPPVQRIELMTSHNHAKREKQKLELLRNLVTLMSGPVTYRHDESIAVITLDDGKVNVLGPSHPAAMAKPEAVLDRALEAAREFATLNQQAHAATKLRTRADALAGIRAGIDGMPAEFGL